MGIVTYLHTDSSYREVVNLQELKITQTINEHATLHLTAILKETSEIEYVSNTNAYDTIEVVKDEPEYKTIFKGIVRNIEIQQIDKVYYLFVTGVSGSFFADIEKKSCSFQDKGMTYYEMVTKAIESPFELGDGKEKAKKPGGIIDRATNGATIDKFIMQFKETDWEFVKRMASHFNAGLIPSLRDDTPKIIMGIPQGTPRGKIEKYNFFVNKDLQRYMISSKNENTSLGELDTVSFHVETTDEFDIGDTLTYQYKDDKTMVSSLYVKSKQIEMVDGALRFRYSFSSEKGLSVDKFYNEKIVGLSLQGVVLDRIQDTVKVHLEIDKTQDVGKAWKFPYTTPYTAEGSAGWYVMPEVEDTVYIYFPNREEHFGVGLNGVRVKNTGTDKIKNPEIKYLRTKDGKEMKLAPDEVVITCCNSKDEESGEENKIYIQLNQDSSITIQSTKPIHINSDGDINFTADKNICFAAEDEIKLKCQSSQIKMDSEIQIVSSVVKVNG